MRMPSTTNITTTFFKQKGFKKMTDNIRASSILNTSLIKAINTKKAGKDKENDQAVILQKKSNFEMRMRYLSKLTYH